jgi:sodium-dependent dicarboxylate transporter 2/3/5
MMPSRSSLTLLLCLAAGALTYALVDGPPPLRLGMSLFALIASLWITQALPLSATALLVPALAALTGVLTVKDALAAFAQPVIFLFLGGFALASALTRHGLDRALALQVLKLARGRPRHAVFWLFGLTAVLSMWLSNTATTAMMLPLALGLLGTQAQADDPATQRTRWFVLLGLAFSASIGGMATLVGSPPNAIAAAATQTSFAAWMMMALPVAALLLPASIGVLYLMLRPRWTPPPADPQMAPKDHSEPPWQWTRDRLWTLAIFGLTVAGWVSGGWLGPAIGVSADMDTLVALLAIALLSVSKVVSWSDIERQTQWGVLMLFGGGLALSQVMMVTGTSDHLAQWLIGGLGGAHALVLLIGVVLAVMALTSFVSNTASAALFIPVVLSLSAGTGLDHQGLAMAVALAASCAFMLPVATPPNAIVFASGLLPQREMLKQGAAVSAVAALLISGWMWWAAP